MKGSRPEQAVLTRDTDMSKTEDTRRVIETMVEGLNDHRINVAATTAAVFASSSARSASGLPRLRCFIVIAFSSFTQVGGLRALPGHMLPSLHH